MTTVQLQPLLGHIHSLASTPGVRHRSDRQLLDDFACKGEESAFATLVARHGPMVLGVCRRVLRHEQDAEDAFQATFLVLARNLGSIRKREALANWLHGVAYRTAMKAKRGAARRRKHEGGPRPEARRPASPSWDDVHSVLDEEVRRLAPCYREAFVSCVLEGKGGREVAAELGCKEGTVKSRVNRARQELRQQLVRRGIDLSALLAALSVAESAGRAGVPALLSRLTIRSGLLVAAGGPAAGVTSPQVAALAAGVTRAMFPTKTKIALALLLAASLFAGGAGVHQALAGKGREDTPWAKSEPRAAEKETAADEQSVTITGRVLGPDGKPFAGAKVFVVTRGAKKENLTVKATSGEGGRFRVSVSRSDVGREAKLVAAARGHGPDWIEVAKRPKAGEVTLRLVEDDVPITGRVLNLEGRPIVGASVTVAWVDAVDLKPWLADRAKGNLSAAKGLATVAFEGPAAVTTDKAGRFTLRGFGRDRVAHLMVRAAGVEDNDFEVIARAGPVGGLRLGNRVVHPADATLTVLPCKPIVGTVRDKKTGEPVRGVRVVALSHTWNRPGATTDEKGRYRIEGVGKRKDYMVAAGALPYFNSTHLSVADTPGLAPLTVDFDLERGVVVKGRLTDKDTGKPVRGHVSYSTTSDNPNLKDFTDVGKPQVVVIDLGKTADDGSFTVVCVPGPGLLTARADDRDAYPMARLEGVKNVGNRILQGSHAVVPIDPSETDPKSRVRDIALEAARSLAGNVVGPDAKPVAGVHVAGLHAVWSFGGGPEKLPSASFKAHGLRPKEPRGVLFFHRERRLAKLHKVAAEDEEPLAVRLEATGALAGRVADAKGRPRAGLKVRASYRMGELEQARIDGKDFKDLPWELLFEYSTWNPILNRETTTDKDGKFRLDGLISGLKYDLAMGDGEVQEITREHLSVEAGKDMDLGDLKGK